MSSAQLHAIAWNPDAPKQKLAKQYGKSTKTYAEVCSVDLGCIGVASWRDLTVFSEVNFYAENKEQTRVLTFQKEAMYLNAASQPLRDIVILMLQTGMRPEEVYQRRP